MSNLAQFNLKRKPSRFKRWPGCALKGRSEMGRTGRWQDHGDFTSTPAFPPGSSAPRPGGDASAGKPSAPAAPGPRGGPAAWSTDTQTHMHKTQSLLSSAGSAANGAAGFVSGGMAQTAPTPPCAPQGKSEGQRGLSGPQTKNRPSLPRCLLGRCPLVWQPPRLPLSAPPWREQTSLGASFHSDSFQPCLALSFPHRVGKVPSIYLLFFPSPQFC